LASIFLCAALPCFALDFGLVLNQSGEYTNTTGDSDQIYLNHTGSYSPWFSGDFGDTAKLYLSAKISTVYNNEEWKPENVPLLPELGRFDFSWRPLPSVFVDIGRIPFRDASELIAAGLFDGINSSIVVRNARVNMGMLYSGLQYKESAKILMTSVDVERYIEPFDYADEDSYFASRRVVLVAGVDFPDLSPRSTLRIGTLAQFDVNNVSKDNPDTLLHSQYISARFTATPLDSLEFAGTGIAELMENREGSPHGGLAIALGTNWKAPGASQGLAQGELRWSSGTETENGSVAAFTPLTASPQGQVFSPMLSGLLVLKGKYTARLHRSFSAAAEGSYFIRTDGQTVAGENYPGSDRRAVGGELYGTLMWMPATDLLITVGGGAFFPRLGDSFTADAPTLWKITAGFIFSL
jgi:hypothetical protein